MTSVPLRQLQCGAYVINNQRGDDVEVDDETAQRWVETERAWLAMQREMHDALDAQGAWQSTKGEERLDPAEDHALYEPTLPDDTPQD